MTEQKHAGGRPALSLDEKRIKWTLPLSPAELAAIKVAAKRAGLSDRAWVRQAIKQALATA